MKKISLFFAAISSLLISCSTNVSNSSIEENKSSMSDPIGEIYNLYKANGGTQTYEEWYESIKGPKGDKGDVGAQGPKGDKGDKGDNGLNPYDVEGVNFYGCFYYQNGSGPIEKCYNPNSWLCVVDNTIVEYQKTGANNVSEYAYQCLRADNTFIVIPSSLYQVEHNLTKYQIISQDVILYEQHSSSNYRYGICATMNFIIANGFVAYEN